MLFTKVKILTCIFSIVMQTSSAASDFNCCSLSQSALKDLTPTPLFHPCVRGLNNSSPVANTGTEPKLSVKCDTCPEGFCRVGLRCFCPNRFVENEAFHELCRPSFTEKWNKSVGLEDRHRRSCELPPPPDNLTLDNCCGMNNTELDIRVGTSNDCPLLATEVSSYVKTLDNECDPCPFGTCRVGSRCYCPQDFLDSDDQKALCRESFGNSHPESVGKPDTACARTPEPMLPSPDSSPTTQVGKDDSELSGNEDTNKLATAEMVGIVIGSAAGIVALIAVPVKIYLYFRQENQEKARNASDDSQEENTVDETEMT